jgi:hypothetical protein
VASILTGILLLAGIAFGIIGAAALLESRDYINAPVCQPAQHVPCRDLVSGSIVSADIALPGLRGEHYEVKVRATAGGETLNLASPSKFEQTMSVGDQVTVTYWRGAATQVDDGSVVMMTSANPSVKSQNGLLGGAVFCAAGAGTFLYYVRRPLRDLRTGRWVSQTVR